MKESFKSRNLQLTGVSALHPDGYRRSFGNVTASPAEDAVSNFATALVSLTGEHYAAGILTTANQLELG